ncbi:hypothetical protein P692DRAFT_20540937 [Suillus brevipes Sb2]|nr:hypothetical protein P692DRAFT_20540937 [Suillus brevipes Sb2]
MMAYKIDSTKFFSLRTGNLLLPFFSKPLSAYTFIHLRDMKQLGLNERCAEEIAYRGYLLTPSYACSPLVQSARAVSSSLNHCLPTTKPSLRAQSISSLLFWGKKAREPGQIKITILREGFLSVNMAMRIPSCRPFEDETRKRPWNIEHHRSRISIPKRCNVAQFLAAEYW